MRKLAVVFAMGCFSTMAWGQAGEFWFNFGESITGDTNLGTPLAFGGSSSDAKLANGYRFSFRFNFNVGDHYGAEVGYAFNHSDLQYSSAAGSALGAGGAFSQGMHYHQGTFNALYYPFTSDTSHVRPFATAGVQFTDFVPPGGGINYGSQNKFGANFGVGVKVHVHGMWGARFDLRDYIMGKPDFGYLQMGSGALNIIEASAGVGIGF